MTSFLSRTGALIRGGVLLFSLTALTACLPPNEYALKLGGPYLAEGQTELSLRQLQSRRFDTLETERLVDAATATLQDLGFNIAATSAEAGVISGSKDRNAIERDQVALQVALVFLAALGGNSHDPIYDESQVINVSLAVNQSGDKSSVVRVIFDRHITNNKGQLWKADIITDPDIYKEFFEKLSLSAFLEANAV